MAIILKSKKKSYYLKKLTLGYNLYSITNQGYSHNFGWTQRVPKLISLYNSIIQLKNRA